MTCLPAPVALLGSGDVLDPSAMGAPERDGPNAEQIRYWNEEAGPKWIALHDVIDGQIAPLGRLAMDRAAIAPGERVLDVGCGCGGTTVEIARRVGAESRVAGVDISRPMLEEARRRAAAAGAGHAHFEQADAQVHAFAAASFDVVFSRFGVMFFVDPAAAFANLRRALRPAGRLAFACWQSLQDNPWMLVPLGAALQHLPPPPIPAPDAPGPFSFADPERVRRILAEAGFRDIALEAVHQTLTVGGGGSVDAAADFVLQMGPTARVLQDADPALRDAVAASVRTALAPYHTAQDGVRMPSAAWIVTARPGSAPTG